MERFRGGQIALDLQEIGVNGYAGVLNIKPCPPIKEGSGQVVTGAFRHVSNDLVELHVEGENQPIICTSAIRSGVKIDWSL